MLPAGDLIADTLWNTLRVMPGFPHIFFTFTNYGSPRPMEALRHTKEVEVPQIPRTEIQSCRKAVFPGFPPGRKGFCQNTPCQKENTKRYTCLYCPLWTTIPCLRRLHELAAYSNRQIVYSRTLNYPGDVDYWVPDKNPTSFASYREPRPDRFELLPLLER